MRPMPVTAIQYIKLNGAVLGYTHHGDDRSRPVIVFVHGGFLRSTDGPYEALIDLLAEHYEVYALDMRGHGASAAAVEGWSLHALADDVVAFSRELKLDKPVYVGHSLSAFVGLFAEIRHTNSFSALCLLAPGPADPRSDPVDALEFLVEHGQDRQMLRPAFGHMFVHPTDSLLEAMLDAVTLIDRRVFRALQEQNGKTSIEDRLAEISVPVLLVCGSRDTVVPPRLQRDIASKVQRSKEVVFSNEGHLLPNENPAMTAREILAFLEHDRAALTASLGGGTGEGASADTSA